MFRKGLVLIIFLLTVGSVACSQSDPPSRVVEDYLNALVEKDDVLAVNLSCLEWEKSAKAEGASFEGVEVILDSASCVVVEEDGQSATVTCTGKFVFSYAGGEVEEIGLDRRDYFVVFEGGEWRMCGYK
jgi:hypothetical protein